MSTNEQAKEEQANEIVELQSEETKAVVGGAAAHAERRVEEAARELQPMAPREANPMQPAPFRGPEPRWK
jgi:hypothetical protein